MQISPTGEIDSFDDSVDLKEIQKQILVNMGNTGFADEAETTRYSEFRSYSEYINNYFVKNSTLLPVTPGFNSSLESKVDLSVFYKLDDLKKLTNNLSLSNKYFKFDLYLTIDTPSGIQSSTDIDASVFLDDIENTLKGKVCGGELLTYNPFTSINPYDTNYGVLSNVNAYVKTNSAYASRIAFEVFNPIDINDSYADELPTKTVIYQGGTQLPTLDSINNVYSFGGILPEEYNLAIKELETLYRKHISLDDTDNDGNYLHKSAQYRRDNPDNELTVANRVIWDSQDSNIYYLGAKDGVQTKMKITCYFWFEGWDADCTSFIKRNSVDLNLIFATDKKE